MRPLITPAFTLICLAAMAQTPPVSGTATTPSPIAKANVQKRLTFYPTTYVHTESLYTDASGITVVIQNSLPKGGKYTGPNGEDAGYGIFWTRIINETDASVEITITFPADPFSILPVQLFLPADTMTLEKETLYDYGATGLMSFLDTGLKEPTMLHKTINPKEACLFYIGALIKQQTGNGPVRLELVFKEQKLFYRISGISPELDTELVPCGQIVLKK